MVNRSILHKLLLARRLYELSRENLNSTNDLSLGIGVNLLQDAVEAFLLAVSEHVNAGIKSNTAFDNYFDLINGKISPKELPFRARLVALNKLRVNSKHYGLAPAKSETEGLFLTVREFFEEVTKSVLGLTFATVSLIELVQDGESKELLREAEAAFQAGNFEKCLVDCRKAIFVRIESHYDISRFAHEEELKGLALLLSGDKAPFFARNKDYIEKNILNPTDYVVLDYKTVELDLLTSGMDTISFWNVLRLTPELHRRKAGEKWVIKHEFRVLEKDGIKDRAEYVLDTTVNLFVAADQKLAATKSPEYRRYYVTLRKEEVPVYRKADTGSEVVQTTPKGVKTLYVDFRVAGLSGEGIFWHVLQFDEGLLISGYISEDVVSD